MKKIDCAFKSDLMNDLLETMLKVSIHLSR